MVLQGTLAHAAADRPKTSINLSWRRAKNKRNYGIPCDFDILERSKDVDLAARHDESEHEKRYCRNTHVSARTIRVRLAFSMVNFVLPSWPAMRPNT